MGMHEGRCSHADPIAAALVFSSRPPLRRDVSINLDQYYREDFRDDSHLWLNLAACFARGRAAWMTRLGRNFRLQDIYTSVCRGSCWRCSSICFGNGSAASRRNGIEC